MITMTSRLNVILMENEKVFRDQYREILSRTGELNVRTAHTAGKALSLISDYHFDAGIFDIRMTESGSEGLDIIELFREKTPFSYIEVVTAYDEYTEIALQKGADIVLVKPLEFTNDRDRIKMGVINKKIERIFELCELYNVEINIDEEQNEIIDLDRLITHLDITYKVIHQLKGVLINDTLNPLYSKAMWSTFRIVSNNIIQEILCEHGIQSCVEAVIRSKNNQHLSEISDDINLLTFELKKSELIKEHMKEYVAIVEGKVVDFDKNLEKLIDRARINYPNSDRFIRQIGSNTIVKLRSPRIVKG